MHMPVAVSRRHSLFKFAKRTSSTAVLSTMETDYVVTGGATDRNRRTPMTSRMCVPDAFPGFFLVSQGPCPTWSNGTETPMSRIGS